MEILFVNTRAFIPGASWTWSVNHGESERETIDHDARRYAGGEHPSGQNMFCQRGRRTHGWDVVGVEWTREQLLTSHGVAITSGNGRLVSSLPVSSSAPLSLSLGLSSRLPPRLFIRPVSSSIVATLTSCLVTIHQLWNDIRYVLEVKRRFVWDLEKFRVMAWVMGINGGKNFKRVSFF